MSDPLIRMHDLGFAYGEVSVLTAVSLEVHAGEIVGLVGPDGAGKSTLLRALAGLDAPAGGAILVDGADLRRMSARRRALTIAFVGQEERPSGELTVAEAVGLGRTPYRQPWSVAAAEDRGIIDGALDAVGLGGWGNRPCTQLSGGERHRVVLARALAQQTAVLVLDEPTNHLDAAWRLRLMQVLDQLECTVIAAMHDLDLVLRHFDAVAVVADGGILAHGPPTEVLDPGLLRKVFEVAGDVVPHPQTGLPYLLLTDVDPASN